MKIKKYLLVPLFVVILHPNIIIAQEKNPLKDAPIKGTFRIDKIKKIKSVYIIYAVEDDRKFEIFSSQKRINKSHTCMKIKKGKQYEFLLTPYFDENDIDRFHVTACEINGVLIPLTPGYGFNLYSTNNLTGLCYTNQ